MLSAHYDFVVPFMCICIYTGYHVVIKTDVTSQGLFTSQLSCVCRIGEKARQHCILLIVKAGSPNLRHLSLSMYVLGVPDDSGKMSSFVHCVQTWCSLTKSASMLCLPSIVWKHYIFFSYDNNRPLCINKMLVPLQKEHPLFGNIIFLFHDS